MACYRKALYSKTIYTRSIPLSCMGRLGGCVFATPIIAEAQPCPGSGVEIGKELKRREPVRPAGNECNRTVDYSPIAAGSLARSREDHQRPAPEVASYVTWATRAPGGHCGCSTHEWSQQARQPNTRPLKPVFSQEITCGRPEGRQLPHARCGLPEGRV